MGFNGLVILLGIICWEIGEFVFLKDSLYSFYNLLGDFIGWEWNLDNDGFMVGGVIFWRIV